MTIQTTCGEYRAYIADILDVQDDHIDGLVIQTPECQFEDAAANDYITHRNADQPITLIGGDVKDMCFNIQESLLESYSWWLERTRRPKLALKAFLNEVGDVLDEAHDKGLPNADRVLGLYKGLDMERIKGILG